MYLFILQLWFFILEQKNKFSWPEIKIVLSLLNDIIGYQML